MTSTGQAAEGTQSAADSGTLNSSVCPGLSSESVRGVQHVALRSGRTRSQGQITIFTKVDRRVNC